MAARNEVAVCPLSGWDEGRLGYEKAPAERQGLGVFRDINASTQDKMEHLMKCYRQPTGTTYMTGHLWGITVRICLLHHVFSSLALTTGTTYPIAIPFVGFIFISLPLPYIFSRLICLH